MTRARLPPGDVLQKAYGVLDKFKISRTFFIKTDQEGCAVAASDLNAANGITSISTIPESFGSTQKKTENKDQTTEITDEDNGDTKSVLQPSKSTTVHEEILKKVENRREENATENVTKK